MLNRSGIIKETAVAPSQILFNVQNQMSVGVIVDEAVGTAGEDGRKIVKAGTPLNGDLTARGTAFVAAKDTSNPAVGVLLHDVDVTEGDANGTLLIWGFVNLNRMDSTTAGLITATRKTELAGRVWFLKD
jgi:hypothetical protein